MRIRIAAVLGLSAVVTVVGGCSSVSVTPSGGGIAARPKPGDCKIEFFRSRAPERAYDELAGLHATGSLGSAEMLQEAMRAKACGVGADAVIVTRDYVPGSQGAGSFMTGTAVKYRVTAQGAQQPSPSASKQ